MNRSEAMDRSEAARGRLDRATARLDPPFAVVDAEAFEHNAAALAGLADAADIACDQVNRWCEAGDESASAMGWGVLARRMARPGGWSDDDLARKIETIERTIHRSPNRARHAMNGALIAIGMRNAGLRKLALAAAERIGPVEVDHGETGCKTPDAAAYIMKGVEYQQSRAAGKIRSAQKPKTKSVRSTAAKRKKSKSAMVRR